MKAERIAVTPPVEPVVAVLEVTQKELDLLTGLLNLTATPDGTSSGIYKTLVTVGGNHKTWDMNPTGHTNAWQVTTKPTYTGKNN